MSEDATPISLPRLIGDAAASGRLVPDESLRGFGGLHGGLTLAVLAAAMKAAADGRGLRSVSGQFRRPLRAPSALVVQRESSSRTVSWLAAQLSADDQVSVTARAVFAAGSVDAATPVHAAMPDAPPATSCPVFTIPPEFVPFGRLTEIRPVGDARPFSGAARPELTAWLRWVGDDEPVDESRLIVLMDCLAPSYGAMLRAPVPLPTVAYTVTPGAGLSRTTSPWLLLRARTVTASADGWSVERLDAWAPDGAHLGAAEQLRMLAA